MRQEQILVVGILIVLVAAAFLREGCAGPIDVKIEITPETLLIGKEYPILWIFYNDSEINSRNWSDFMARGSHVINIPLINLCYKTIVGMNRDYRVEVIGGLQGVAERLGGWERLPKPMRNPRSRVSIAEEDWIRTAILAKYGGLWVSPSTVAIRPFGKMPAKVIGFGQDSSPMYGSGVPGFRALWSPSAEHPMFVEWERRIRDRLENQLGGRQVRGDAKSDWVDLSAIYDVEVDVLAELGRDDHNKTLDLEKIFASGTEGRLPFVVRENAIYFPIPYDDLLNRRHFGWILRSSEEQILDSDLAVRYILEKSLNQIAIQSP